MVKFVYFISKEGENKHVFPTLFFVMLQTCFTRTALKEKLGTRREFGHSDTWALEAFYLAGSIESRLHVTLQTLRLLLVMRFVLFCQSKVFRLFFDVKRALIFNLQNSFFKFGPNFGIHGNLTTLKFCSDF